MYLGLAGMLFALFVPPVLAGVLGVGALKLASHYYKMDIRRPIFDLGVIFGVSLYIYTVAFFASSALGGSILGHVAANIVTTGALAIHLKGAFGATHLTPEVPFLRTKPVLVMTMAGVKGVTAIAIAVHVIIISA